MAKYLIILLLSLGTAKADTNLVWQFPYIRPFLLMRGTNSHIYNECWQFESWNVTNPVGTLVIDIPMTNLPYDLVIGTYNTNFTYTTSNHVAGRTYYYNSAYSYGSNNWFTNASEVIISPITNVIPVTNILTAPRLLGIFESW